MLATGGTLFHRASGPLAHVARIVAKAIGVVDVNLLLALHFLEPGLTGQQFRQLMEKGGVRGGHTPFAARYKCPWTRTRAAPARLLYPSTRWKVVHQEAGTKTFHAYHRVSPPSLEAQGIGDGWSSNEDDDE